MNSERTQAYGRVIKTLDELGPTKLLPQEQDRIREAADALIFAGALDEAVGAIQDVETLARHLAETGRWSDERAQRLAGDVTACGPVAPV